MKCSTTTVDNAKRILAKKLACQEGYSGVGIGRKLSGSFEIVVFVEDECSEVLETIPKTCRGFAVRIVISGRAKKRQ